MLSAPQVAFRNRNCHERSTGDTNVKHGNAEKSMPGKSREATSFGKELRPKLSWSVRGGFDALGQRNQSV